MAEGGGEGDGDATAPPCFFCGTSEEMDDDASAPGGAGAPVYAKRRWEDKRLVGGTKRSEAKKRQLRVFFMKDGLHLLRKWNLRTEKILRWANAWSSKRDLKEVVPEFVEETDIDDSHVRIEFNECRRYVIYSSRLY